MMETLWASIQFFSRLPVPRGDRMQAVDVGASAAWIPAVGLLIGVVLAGVRFATAEVDPWVSAFCTVVVWLWITGAMHVDGAADLADALGARHKDPDRFLTALRDPSLGTFGVLAVLCIVLAKLVALHALANDAQAMVNLFLTPAWTRLGALYWAARIPPLADGSGKQFGAAVGGKILLAWFLLLAGASVLLAPVLLVIPLLIAGWAAFLKWRIRGMNGDALGAGIEWCEAGALLLIAIASNATFADDWLIYGVSASWPGI